MEKVVYQVSIEFERAFVDILVADTCDTEQQAVDKALAHVSGMIVSYGRVVATTAHELFGCSTLSIVRM